MNAENECLILKTIVENWKSDVRNKCWIGKPILKILKSNIKNLF